MIREVCATPCEEDGASYDPETVKADEITVNKEYHGVRVSVVAHLDTARQRISMDIGFGDIVTPAPQELAFPTLIDTVPQAEIMAYSLETVVAEKFHAMISLSRGNSRMKDFFDVYRILVTDRVDTAVLEEAIMATFTNRATLYEDIHPLFSVDFFTKPTRVMFWNGFLKKMKYQDELDFAVVGELIVSQLKPYWEKYKQSAL